MLSSAQQFANYNTLFNFRVIKAVNGPLETLCWGVDKKVGTL